MPGEAVLRACPQEGQTGRCVGKMSRREGQSSRERPGEKKAGSVEPSESDPPAKAFRYLLGLW